MRRADRKQDYLLLQALRRVLRPLARLCIEKNVSLAALNDLIADLYANCSRESADNPTQENISEDIEIGLIGAEIVAIWTGSPEFRSATGEPNPLPYVNDGSPSFSFSALVESVSKDVRSHVILEELQRQNILRYNETTDQVWLNSEAFVPQDGWASKLYYFSRNIEDHLDAAITNILSEKPPYLDRSVYYNGLSPESVRELQAEALDNATKALRTLNRRAFELSEQDKEKTGAGLRINFGTWFYSDATFPAEERE